MNCFLYRLVPPRQTFDRDMSENERAIMARHVAYWRDLAERGHVIVFGPVTDPNGSWGLAVVAAASAEDVHAFGLTDPAILTQLARFEVCAMPHAIVGKTRSVT